MKERQQRRAARHESGMEEQQLEGALALLSTNNGHMSASEEGEEDAYAGHGHGGMKGTNDAGYSGGRGYISEEEAEGGAHPDHVPEPAFTGVSDEDIFAEKYVRRLAFLDLRLDLEEEEGDGSGASKDSGNDAVFADRTELLGLLEHFGVDTAAAAAGAAAEAPGSKQQEQQQQEEEELAALTASVLAAADTAAAAAARLRSLKARRKVSICAVPSACFFKQLENPLTQALLLPLMLLFPRVERLVAHLQTAVGGEWWR